MSGSQHNGLQCKSLPGERWPSPTGPPHTLARCRKVRRFPTRLRPPQVGLMLQSSNPASRCLYSKPMLAGAMDTSVPSFLTDVGQRDFCLACIVGLPSPPSPLRSSQCLVQTNGIPSCTAWTATFATAHPPVRVREFSLGLWTPCFALWDFDLILQCVGVHFIDASSSAQFVEAKEALLPTKGTSTKRPFL